jgi:hypothetical protein
VRAPHDRGHGQTSREQAFDYALADEAGRAEHDHFAGPRLARARQRRLDGRIPADPARDRFAPVEHLRTLLAVDRRHARDVMPA